MTPDSLSDAKKVMKIIDILEDNDDVEEIAHNLEMTDELATALEEA
jgi:transcriptional/translational regulatory protein YebC/TACO1